MNAVTMFWIFITIFFFVTEIATDALVSVWFMLGGLVAIGASFFTDSVPILILIFAVVSIAFIALLRPITKNKIKTDTNVDALIGQKGIVTVEINNLLSTGQVQIDGLMWSAKNIADEIIKTETVVQVMKVEGNKLIVEPNERKE